MQRLSRTKPMRASIARALAKDHAKKKTQKRIAMIIVKTAAKRALDCVSRALRRKSVADIFNGSVGWFCQSSCGSFMGKSLGMESSFDGPAFQYVFDSANFHRDVGRR